MSTVFIIWVGALGLAVTIIVAILTALVTTEARGNVPVLCRRLLDRTAARLPAEMQDRREEWESELADAADRPITQMAIAVRIWRDGRVLAQEATAGLAEVESSDGRGGEKRATSLAVLLRFLEGPLAAGRRIGRSIDQRTIEMVVALLSTALATAATLWSTALVWAAATVAAVLGVVAAMRSIYKK